MHPISADSAAVENTVRVSPTVPFQIRGRLFTAIVLELSGDVDDAFYAALDAKLKQGAAFFAYVPLVLDLEKAAGKVIDFKLLVLEMRTRRLMLVGVQNASPEQKRAAQLAGLITLGAGREMPADEALRLGAATSAAPRGATKLITEPVRSGQRVFADAGDLIIMGSVGSGAEVIARGNVHIYGTLRGRALAGANGDAKARIFCQSFEAELVAIGGVYRTSDDFEGSLLKQRVQMYLDGDALRIEPLK
ncbi:MAG TPA: septum site-determining protein MinC [Alphaproteobacteria bacterium]|nr:septum site-determining protein MinC [Alphaproteobacteria bacterium]